MSFLFNFPDPNTDSQPEKGSTDSEVVNKESVLPCHEITENEKKVELLVSTLKHTQYHLSSGLCITCLDNQQVEEVIKGGNSDKNQATLTAIQTHTDLIPNVYEGGLKVWECSVDLIEYLDKSAVQFKGKVVLELGCGAGLPGIYAMLKGAEQIHLQDYNTEVLETYTIPNVRLNKKVRQTESSKAETCQCRYFSGDWSHLKDKLVAENNKYDVILTAETIYQRDNYSKLTEIFKHCLKDKGEVYLSAKSNYFGVGGGVCDFINFVEKGEIFDVQVCHNIEEGTAVDEKVFVRALEYKALLEKDTMLVI